MDDADAPRSRKQNNLMIALSVIVVLLLGLIFRSCNYVDAYYEKEKIKSVTIVLSDIKAGLERSEDKSVLITDKNKMNDLLNILEDKRIMRLFPHWGGVGSNSTDRLEMRVLLVSDKDKILDYHLTSTGQLTVRKGNDNFANSFLVNGKVTELFLELTPFVGRMYE
ncbi:MULTISPECIES: hypothetical protein [unclassified Paenibacillus]|uniref:hypothetical protein n=1 Tax=unclassified Paenibacillus TaxID=185978 RepID=UPI000955C17E|nr:MULTISPECIES: hypothetical protein [unclassified Paenibacillus]ASS67347.1 hypothetical protein CIC07_15240 [Paenibacillus sp. RUD330]SIQ80522.1 hypothetical protein SAMN05880555_2379 [Paenibacillus sp. RU4X]SIR01877.1 hypothetical protein SAMN05880570_2378 [Paenibacillus sp. RU4T]